VWLGEQGIGLAGYAGGKALGGAAGLLSPVPGGAFAGQLAGGAAGMTFADGVNQWIDHSLYGTPIDLSTRQLVKDYALNLGGAYGGEWLAGKLPGIIKAVAPHLEPYLGPITDRASKAAGWIGERLPGAGGVSKQLEKAGEVGEATRYAYQEGVPSAAEPKVKDYLTKPEERAGRLEVIKRETGATPESAAWAQVPEMTKPAAIPGLPVAAEEATPTQRWLAHSHELPSAFYDIRKGEVDAFKGKYDAVLKDHLAKPGSTIGILKEIGNQEKYATQGINPKIYNADVNNLVNWGKKVFNPTNLTEKQMDDIARVTLAQKGRAVRGATYVAGSTLDPYEEVLGEAKGLPVKEILELARKSRTEAPVKDLLQYARWAGDVAAHSKDEVSAKAASAIEDQAYEALKGAVPKETLPRLSAVDQQYRSFKLDYSQPTGRAVANARNSIEAGDALFSDPQLMQRLGANADAGQKGVLFRHFGEWMANNPERFLTTNEAEAKVNASMVAGFAPPRSVFADPKSLMAVSGELENLRVAPDAFNRVTAAFEKGKAEDFTKSYVAARDYGMTKLRELGPVGQRVMQEVNGLRGDPKAQKELIDKFFGNMTDPNFFKGEIGKMQGLRGPMMTQFAQPKAGELGGQPWILHMMTRPGATLAYGGAAALGGLMTGHISPFWGMMFAGAAGVNAYRMYQKAILKSLTSEYAAPVMSALANRSYDRLGAILAKAGERDITKAVAANLAAGATRRGFGNPLEGPANPAPSLGPDSPPPKWKPAPEMKFGPMADDLERKQATAMSTERGKEDSTHVDQIEDLNKQVSKGSTPNIHQDLQSGRLASAEVRKLVESTGPSTPADMFKGMSIPDAIEAFAKGTPDEQALGLPALAQKIQNEGQNLQPAERRALMVQLRRAMGQTAQVPEPAPPPTPPPMPPPQGAPPPQQANAVA